ncbi:MAG: hypothetical protein AAF585_00980 [Verrucomicrobiota bacterium]
MFPDFTNHSREFLQLPAPREVEISASQPVVQGYDVVVSVPEKEFVPRDAEGPPDEQSRAAAAPLPPEDEDDRVLARQARSIRRIQGSQRVQKGQQYHEWLGDLALNMKGTKYHDIGSTPQRPKASTFTRVMALVDDSAAAEPASKSSRSNASAVRLETPKIPDMELSESRWSYWVDVDSEVDRESQTSFSLADWMENAAEGVETNLGNEGDELRSSPIWNRPDSPGAIKSSESATTTDLGPERGASFSVSDWMEEIAEKGDEVVSDPYKIEAPETASPDFKWDELDELDELDESSLSFETYEPPTDDDDRFDSFWDALEAQSEEAVRHVANAPKRPSEKGDLMVAQPDFDLNQPELFLDDPEADAPQLLDSEGSPEPSEVIVGYTTSEDGEVRYWTARDWFILQKWRAIMSANGNGVFGDDGSMIHQFWSKFGPLFGVVAMWAALTNFLRKVIIFWGPRESDSNESKKV